MAKAEKKAAASPTDKYEGLAAEIDATMTDAERKAVKTLTDAGWLALIHPRVENSTTGRGVRSWQAKGRYAIGLVKNRIMR